MDDRELTEEFLSTETVFRGKLIEVDHWKVRLPNGETALREVVRHPGASAVVAVDQENRVVLVRQHRIAAGRLTFEIPAGKLDHPGEDALQCAKRELEEETGLSAESWRFLTIMDTTPGFCDEKISLYLAAGLSQHEAHPDGDEFVSVVRLPISRAVQKVMDGSFRDGKTALGILMAWNLLNRKNG